MSYPGGKAGGAYQAIINQMPPHRTYVEAFLGGGAVIRHKRPAERNIAIDLSRDALDALDIDGSAPAWHNRVVEPIEADAMDWLERAPLGRDALVYCDPPYVISSRRSSRPIYAHEMTDDDHARLLAALIDLPCMVMISGYSSLLYEHRLRDWRRVEFYAMTRRGLARENLWCNFAAPVALHDYRHLGADFRERERIRRKALRWKANLARMTPLERQAILSACGELPPPPPPPAMADSSLAIGGAARAQPLLPLDA